MYFAEEAATREGRRRLHGVACVNDRRLTLSGFGAVFISGWHGIVALRKAHTRSSSSRSSVPGLPWRQCLGTQIVSELGGWMVDRFLVHSSLHQMINSLMLCVSVSVPAVCWLCVSMVCWLCVSMVCWLCVSMVCWL